MLPRYVERELGGNDRDIGLLVAVYAVSAIGCRPLVARVGRSGPRRLMWLGSVITAVGLVMHAGAANLGVVGAGRAVVAVGETLLFVGFASRITSLAPEGREAEYTSIGSVAVFAALGLGPIAGEWFVRRDEWAASFFVAAGLCLVAAVVAAVGVRADAPRADGAPAERTTVFHTGGVPTGAVLALVIGAYFAWNSYIALHADDLGMADAAGIFVLFSAITLTARLLGATLPERIGLSRAVRIACIGVTVALLITAVWASPAGIYVGTAVMALGLAFAYPALTALTLQATRPQERTSVLSTFTMFFEVGSGGAGLIIGPIADATSRRVAFGVGAGVSAIGWLAMTPVERWALRRRQAMIGP